MCQRHDSSNTERLYIEFPFDSLDKDGSGNGSDRPKTKTVLVASKEKLVRSLAVNILEKAGYEVIEASSGTEASIVMEQYRLGEIQVVLIDYNMRHASGAQLAAIVRHMHPESRVVYMSGGIDAADEKHILIEGARYIQKPFTARELAATIDNVTNFG